MSWTRASWTRARFARRRKGLRVGEPLIASQPRLALPPGGAVGRTPPGGAPAHPPAAPGGRAAASGGSIARASEGWGALGPGTTAEGGGG